MRIAWGRKAETKRLSQAAPKMSDSDFPALKNRNRFADERRQEEEEKEQQQGREGRTRDLK